MKYSTEEVIKYLTKNGTLLSEYIVILGDEKTDETLYSIHQNVLFFEIIEDNKMYKNCIEFIKKNGTVYNNKNELKKDRPMIFGV